MMAVLITRLLCWLLGFQFECSDGPAAVLSVNACLDQDAGA
jgi:hypothetical protein